MFAAQRELRAPFFNGLLTSAENFGRINAVGVVQLEEQSAVDLLFGCDAVFPRGQRDPDPRADLPAVNVTIKNAEL